MAMGSQVEEVIHGNGQQSEEQSAARHGRVQWRNVLMARVRHE